MHSNPASILRSSRGAKAATACTAILRAAGGSRAFARVVDRYAGCRFAGLRGNWRDIQADRGTMARHRADAHFLPHALARRPGFLFRNRRILVPPQRKFEIGRMVFEIVS